MGHWAKLWLQKNRGPYKWQHGPQQGERKHIHSITADNDGQDEYAEHEQFGTTKYNTIIINITDVMREEQ